MSFFIHVVSSNEETKFRHFAVVRFVIFLKKVVLFAAVFSFVVRVPVLKSFETYGFLPPVCITSIRNDPISAEVELQTFGTCTSTGR